MNTLATLAVLPPEDEVRDETFFQTLNLGQLAGLAEGDDVRILGFENPAPDLFEITLDLLEKAVDGSNPDDDVTVGPSLHFVPQSAELRARFKLAEVLVSYTTLNALLDRFAPVAAMATENLNADRVKALTSFEISQLRNYRDQIATGLEHAHAKLKAWEITQFDAAEISDLSEILSEARARYQALETLLGTRLLHDVERSVERLYAIHQKIAGVERTITGIFLIDSEIMFVPSAELVDIVDNIFRAIGDPYVADHVDGTLLLAARNLLIQVVSFYAYYGREQIYRIFGTRSGAESRRRVSNMVSNEIKTLFSACKTGNRLILTRVMSHTEREFEVSIEAIEREACHRAIMEVEKLAPPRKSTNAPKKQSFLSRLSDWLFR